MLPTNKTYLSVRETAEALCVSIDTIRRWDTSGILQSVRLDGRNRYFAREEIEKHLYNKTYSPTEAAKKLGISLSTLRRFEKKGKITSQRNDRGEREYTAQELDHLHAQNVPSLPQSPPEKTSYSSLLDAVINSKTSYPQLTELKELEQEYQNVNIYINKLQKNQVEVGKIKKSFPSFETVFAYKRQFLAGCSFLLLLFVILGSYPYLSGYIHKNFDQDQFRQSESDGQSILGADSDLLVGTLHIDIPSAFSEPVFLESSATISGVAEFRDDVIIRGELLDVSAGQILAPNLIYSLNAGSGVSITEGQTPTITNDGVLSLQGTNGAVSLTAGSGISISGLTISSTLSTPSVPNSYGKFTIDSTTITAGSTQDTFTFIPGSGITLTPDSTNETLTITSSGTSQWTTSGTSIYYSGGNVGIGSTSPAQALDVVGNLKLSGTTTFNSITYTWPNSDGSNGYFLTTNGSGTLTWTQSSGVNYWDQANGSVFPKISTLDLLIGSTSTPSAKFAILNVNSGTPTASVSAGTAGGTYLTATGNLQTTANQAFRLGGSTTGNIIISPLNGSGTTLNTGTFNLSSGKTYQINGSDVLNATTLGTEVVTSSLTTVGALASGSIASGFGTILTTNTIQGSNITASGTTGLISTGTGAGLDFQGTGNHTIQATAGVLQLAATTLTGAITGNNQSITGLNNLSAAGTITFSNFNANNNILYATVSTGVIAGASTDSSSLCLMSGASAPSWSSCPGSGSGGSKWTQGSGVLYPNNTTLDLLIGGSASSSAKFAVLNVNSGTPIASVSAGATGATYMTASGSIQSTAKQHVIIGGDTSGNITISPLNGASGSTLTINALTTSLSGTTELSASSLISFTTSSSFALNGGSTITTDQASLNLFNTTATTMNFAGATTTFTVGATSGTFNLRNPAINVGGGSATTISTVSDDNLTLTPNGSGQLILTSDFDTGVLIGTSSNIQAPLSVSGGIGNNALAIFNQTNSGNIIAASTSGTTKFVIENDGDIKIPGGQTIDALNSDTLGLGTTNATTISIGRSGQGITLPGFTGQNGVLYGTSGTGVLAQATSGSSNLCLMSGASAPSWTSCPGSGSGGSKWTEGGSGVLYPNNPTVDLLLGGSASTSAKFAVLNVAGGTPVASVSAGANGASYITAAGNIQTTAHQPLTLGGSTTGHIVLDSGTGAITFSDLATFNAGATIALGQSFTFSGFTTANAVLYTNTSGVVTRITETQTASLCLISGAGASGAPSWSTCPGGSGGSNWTANGGALYPNNSTLDLFIGGSSSTSAKFTFLNINSGDPTASVSGNLSLAVPTSASPATLFNIFNGGSFNFQNSPGGNAGLTSRLFIAANGNIGIGSTSPAAKLDIGGSSSNITNTSGDITINAASNVSFAGDSLINVGSLIMGGALSGGQTATFSGSGTFATIDTGQGATEVYLMNQNLQTTNNATFNALTLTTALTVANGGTGNSTLTTNGVMYGNGTSALGITAAGTTGQALIATTGNPPSWGTIGSAGITDNSLDFDDFAATLDLDASLQLNQTTYTWTQDFTGTTTTGFTYNADSLSSGKGFYLLNDGATQSSNFSGDLAQISYTPTYTTGAGLSVTGNVLDVNRTVTLNNNGNILTVSGALLALTDNAVQSDGTLSHTANVLSLTQNFGLSSGAVLNISNSGVGAGLNLSSNSGGQAAVIINKTGNVDILTASSSGITRFVLNTSGNVGVGVSSPAFRLDLSDSQASTISAMITNSSTNSDADVLALKVGNTSNPETSNRFVTFLNGNGVNVGNIQGNGSGGVSYATSGIDFAEYYKKDNLFESFEAGDIVCFGSSGGVTKCTTQTGKIAGIVSDRPGFVGGSDHAQDPGYLLVGLIGQLPAKANVSSGAINPSDPLTYNSSGFVTKASQAGTIVGRALEGFDPKTHSEKKIMISLYISWYDPGAYLTTDGILQTTSNPKSVEIAQNSLPLTPIASNPLPQGSIGSTTSAELDNLEDKVSSLEKTIGEWKLETHILLASLSAEFGKLKDVKSLNLVPFASSSSSIVTIEDNLLVLGPATLLEASVQDSLSIANTLMLSANSINTLGEPLEIQPLQQAPVHFLGGEITIETDGTLHVLENATFVKDLSVGGVLSAQTISTHALSLEKNEYVYLSDTESLASGSAGTSLIKTGQTKRVIHNSQVRSESLMYITPVGKTSGQTLYISEQKEGESFTVEIENSVDHDIAFNFLIIDRKEKTVENE